VGVDLRLNVVVLPDMTVKPYLHDHLRHRHHLHKKTEAFKIRRILLQGRAYSSESAVVTSRHDEGVTFMRRSRLLPLHSIVRCALLAVGASGALIVSTPAAAQVRQYPLDSPTGL